MLENTEKQVKMSEHADAVHSLIETHLARYPQMQLTDIYKLLHQGTIGSSHAISKRDSAREWLEHEWEINPPNAAEPLIETVNPSGTLVRLNLRPYQAVDGALIPLLDAMIRSVQAAARDTTAMAAAWNAFVSMVEMDSEIQEHFPLREVRLFGRQYGDGWSNVQHSPVYVRTYRPAYRVLTHIEAQELLSVQQILVNER